MRAFLAGAALAAVSFLPTAHADHLGARVSIDGQVDGTLQPGVPAALQLEFFEAATGKAVTEFVPTHEKLNHTVIISQDLSLFAHVHPSLGADGMFGLDVNRAASSYDPDNQDAARAFPKPGAYYVFSEVQPRGATGTYLVKLDAAVSGQASPAPVALDPESDGSVVKYFTADGQPGQVGDRYRATLSAMAMPGMVHLTLMVAQKAGAGYAEVTDLQDWLGMKAHGMLISVAGATAAEKGFWHLHAGMDMHHGTHTPAPVAGGALTFMIHGALPPKGEYKLWTQVKHQDRILTFPFVFEL
jgi:hypothetical protein